MRRHVFHVIFYQDRGWWVAQCLERNLAAAAKDRRELPSTLETVLKVQIEADEEAGVEPFTTLPQAPRRFWQMFQNATHTHFGVFIRARWLVPTCPSKRRPAVGAPGKGVG